MGYKTCNNMIPNILTKDIIFSHTTAENIYTKFLGLTDFPKGNISSPFSEDKKPSFKIWKNGTFKCNSSGKQGDAFEFVANLKQLDCKTQFNEVLQIVAKEMNLPVQAEPNKKTFAKENQTFAKPLQKPLQKKDKTFATDEKPSTLTVAIREFTELDLSYWNKLGVAKETLEAYKLHSVSNYTWTGKKPIYTKKESVAFAIELQGNFKLYIPNQIEIGINKNVLPPFPVGIFGLEQLGTEKKETLIICAGEKDVITANSRGFNAVTFGSEASHPKNEQIQQLQSLCNNLFICYDNDKTGETGRNAITKRFPEITTIQLPKNEAIKGYDVTDYFQEHTAQDFQKIIDLAVKNKSVDEVSENTDLTIFHKAENYISKHYDLRFDIISNEIKLSKKDKNIWEELNENSLYVEMQKKHLKISTGNLKAIITSDFVPKFNPLKDYFENLPIWDKKTDYITQYLNYVELEDGEDREQFIYHFKKWCVRSVKCSTIEGYFNKQAFVLSDDAKGQSIGKTTFIRYLVPNALKKYYCENLPDDKDAIKRLGQNFIINLDELATLSRTDINKLKSMFSADEIKTRLPYGSKDVIISRVANFIGSTNMSTFLVDETGSVRWLCFIVKKINFNYSLEFNIDNLWIQAFALSKDENFKEAMTVEDIHMNEIRNDKFQILSPERELIPKFFEVPINTETAEHLTSTGILNHIALWTTGIRLTTGGIGKALPKCGFIRKKYKDI
jgi:predicted P-loop ATPase